MSAKPSHILDFSEVMFQEVMHLFNVNTDNAPVDPRLANRQKSKKFVTLPKLKSFLISHLSVSEDKVTKLIEKIDHKNKEKITWTEFLLFLNNEAEKREIINDQITFNFAPKQEDQSSKQVEVKKMNVFGSGTKRFLDGPKMRPYSNGQPINYGIDFLLKMQLDYTTVFLMIFENYTVGLFNMTTKRFEEFLRLKFPSDYSQPSTAIDLKDPAFLESFGRDSRIQTESSTRKVMKNKRKIFSVKPQKEIKESNNNLTFSGISKSIKAGPLSIPKKVTAKYTTANISKLGGTSKRLLHKVTVKASERSFDFGTVEEDSEDITPNSKKFATISKKNTKGESGNDFIKISAPTVKKEIPRMYGVLGVDVLNPDDNILMRGNINSKKENSLSLNYKDKEYISENKLKSRKSRFYSYMHEIDVQLRRNDKIIQEKKNKFNSENSVEARLMKARENLEGYDPKKYNVNLRIQGFKDKIMEKYDNIYEKKDKITHISSVGDPYIMFNQQQQRRQLGTAQARSRPVKEDFIYNPYDPQNHKKELKNSIRAKAEQKKAEKLAKQTKKIHINFACFDPKSKKLILALVDCEIRIYKVKENGKRIKLEDDPYSFKSKNIVTYMEINRFVVNNRQILILGTNVGTIEIYYISPSQANPVAQVSEEEMSLAGMLKWRREDILMSSLLKTFSMEKKDPKPRNGYDSNPQTKSKNSTEKRQIKSCVRDNSKSEGEGMHIVKLRYAKDVGLIV